MGVWPVVLIFALAIYAAVQQVRLSQARRLIEKLRIEKLLAERSAEPERDGLTSLLSQHALRRCLDSGEAFQGVVAVCDLDGFKSINDRFGHLVGDEVLRDVGNLLLTSVRAEDRAYRWGGDEFAILFRDTEAAQAEARMREIEGRLAQFHVRGHERLQEDAAVRIRISWGVSDDKGDDLKQVLDRADRAMYEQKRVRSGPHS